NRADWLQKLQSSGQPPVLADRMPSTSTSGPHHASRTSWASAASAGTDSGWRAASALSSSGVSWRHSSSSARPASANTSRVRITAGQPSRRVFARSVVTYTTDRANTSWPDAIGEAVDVDAHVEPEVFRQPRSIGDVELAASIEAVQNDIHADGR